jgi:hypothetical protein
MILPDTQREVKCKTCGKTAYRQELPVYHPGQATHMVIYETHDPALNGKAHNAALNRMEKFYKRVHQLRADLNGLPRDERAVEALDVKAEFIEFDFGPVMPDACHVRVEVIPYGYLKAFSHTAEVKLEQRKLKGLRADWLLKEFKKAAEPAIELLKARRASGEI